MQRATLPSLASWSLVAGCALLAASPAAATTRVVSTSGPYPTIQSAIDASTDGDVVLVPNGTWSGPGNRDLDFDGKAITVRSSSDEPAACMIDCGHAAQGVVFDQGEGPGAVLRGIGIRSGQGAWGGAIEVSNFSSPTLRNVYLIDNAATSYGGAIFVGTGCSPTIEESSVSSNFSTYGGAFFAQAASPTFSECWFVNNDADSGGAFGITGGSDVTFTSCTFASNEAVENSGAGYILSSSVTADECIFQLNRCDGAGGALSIRLGGGLVMTGGRFDRSTSQGHGGALRVIDALVELTDVEVIDSLSYQSWGSGGAVYLENAVARLDGCLIEDSSASGGQGGAIYAKASTVEAQRCTFRGNVAQFGGVARFTSESVGRWDDCRFVDNAANVGGGISLTNDSVLTMANALFDFNRSSTVGGALHVSDGSTLRLVCSTVYNNRCDDAYGGGLYMSESSSTAEILNSIFWENQADGAFESGDQIVSWGALDLRHSCVQNLDHSLGGGLGNINDDPMLTDPVGPDGGWATGDEDYALLEGSPCIDAGLDVLLPDDLLDLDGMDGTVGQPLPLDLIDAARVQGDQVDMGALESPFDPAGEPDLDGDGLVGTPDLLILLADWGATDGPADLDGNGMVGTPDLLILLAAWSG